MHAYTYHPTTRELLGTFPVQPDPAELDRKHDAAFAAAIAPAAAARDAAISAAQAIGNDSERTAALARAQEAYEAQAEQVLEEVAAATSPDVWMVPAWATLTPPPELAAHQVATFDGQAWVVVPDWRGHVYWLADGTRAQITELATEPPADALDAAPVLPTTASVPAAVTSVSMMQFQLALLAAGKLDAVEAAIATADRAAQITWRTAAIVKRDNPLIALLAPAAGLSDAAVNALFEQASLL
jgi:hypothetical protein